MIASTLSVALVSLAAPGGQVLLVPEEFSTIEEAAAAIAVPQFQIIDVAPGTYVLKQPDLGGAAIRGRTGVPGDVVLVGGWLLNASASDLTLSGGVLYESHLEHGAMFQCSLINSSATGCVAQGLGGDSVVLTSCLLTYSSFPFGNQFSTATLTDCEVRFEGNSLACGGLTAVHTSFINTPVKTGTTISSHFRACRFVGSSTYGLEAHLTFGLFIVNCTFVGNAGPDVLAILGETNAVTAINSIGNFDGVAAQANLTSHYCMEADGFVTPEGLLLPGSTAIGAGNPHVGLSFDDLACAWNIGSDQAGSPQGADCALGDITQDGLVDGADLGVLLANWGQPSNAADLSVNGVVNGADIGLLLANWTN